MPIDPEAIASAEQLIRSHIRRTPVMDVTPSDLGLNCSSLTLKLELFQHAGSFKARGAFYNLLSRELPAAGVAAASGGNHGVAVAYAASRVGCRATIFVPAVSSPVKMARIRAYGARLEVIGERYVESLEACDRWAAESGALTIHAYDQPQTLIGQGTVGLELEQQQPHIDTLLVAVGGGGLIGGIASWYRGRIRIVGVEPELAPTLAKALEAGRPVDAEAGGIAADSLAPKQVGQLMFPLAQQYIDRVALVSDQAIVHAQQTLWDVLRIATEPGGAAAMAALLSGAYQPKPEERVAVLVCGGNTTAVQFGGAGHP